MRTFLNTILLLAVLAFTSQHTAAQSVVDTSTLVGRLELSLRNGEKRAIRDLISISEDPTSGALARQTLADATLFDRQIDFAKLSRQELLNFYYQHSDSIQFSKLLRSFYTTPIENQEVDYELVALDAYQRSDRSMHLRKYFAYTDQAVEFKSIADLMDLVEKIADLHLLEGQAYLLELLHTEAGRLLASDPDAFLHYLNQLLNRPSTEVADALFYAESKGYLRDGTLAHYLSRLCNVPFKASWSSNKHKSRFTRLVDSLGGLERVRAFGYDASISFTRNHFREPVDYYGRVLAEKDIPPFVQHNALLDLVETHHPRALFYISTQLLSDRRKHKTAYPAVHYLYLLRKLTNLGVLVKDKAGKPCYQLDVTGDRVAWTNFVRYWARHYEDYDFDEHRLSFVNRYDRTLETENLERLFRLLNSENDEVALQAYKRITKADPVEVVQLVNKYKDLLRTVNPKVPALKDGRLEQTAELTAYCVRNRLNFNPSQLVENKLDSLLLNLTPKTRVSLENRLINNLDLEELTGVEYWALINHYSLDAGFSIGRILDYSYSLKWSSLLNSDAQLRLYLKKAMLFSRMEGIGVSDGYLRKIDPLSNSLHDRFEELLKSEGDKHISRALKRLLNRGHDGDEAMTELDNFLENPESFTREEVKELPNPTLEQLSELLWRLEDPSPKAKFLYRAYLEKRLNTSLVPDLMSLLIRDESPGEVARLLSSIYHYKFSKNPSEASEAWLNYWRNNSDDYVTWGKTFYQQHINRIDTLPKVSGGDLNAILRSPFYDNKDRKLIFDALPKLVSNRHLFMLRFTPELSWNERVVLSGLKLKYRDLQDLDKLFKKVPPIALFEFILTESATFSLEDRGKLFNAIMRKPWIDELLDEEEFAGYADNVAEALNWYLEESEFLSEYEEQNTALNLARLQFIGKTPAERLKMSIQLDVDEAAKLRIQESILARVAYDQIPKVLYLAPQFAEVNGTRPYNFLAQDFGLPIFNIESSSVIDTFTARHQRLDQEDLYKLYLQEFGLNVTTPDGSLDFVAIADVLKYDIVRPFIGGGGNRRDLYTYGVIKLLELSEGTNLGFHEKLNENQVFYSFSASKRASAWLEYLQDKGKFERNNVPSAPSFNASASN